MRSHQILWLGNLAHGPHTSTITYIASVTHQGSVSFTSKGWGGRTSDEYITEPSGYTNNLLAEDIILTDRGFDVADSVAIMGTTLVTPAFAAQHTLTTESKKHHHNFTKS